MAGSLPALAIDDTAEVVEACSDQAVCSYAGATIPNADELAAALPDGVRVVVIPPPDQAQNVPSDLLAQEFKNATGADTVIVIEDRPSDRYFVASDGDSAAISTVLHSNTSPGGEVDSAALEQVLSSSGSAGPGTQLPGGTIAGGVALVGVLIVGAGVVVLRRRRRRARAARAGEAARRLERDLDDALNGPDGAFVGQAIDRLRERAAALPDVGPQLSSVAGHVSDLFVRVHKRGTDQQVRLLQAQYKDVLGKLLKALDDEYYGDILANPQYWSNPNERVAEVRQAVDSVDRQAVENIKQVNESRDLEFKVALDSLIKTVTEAKLSDVYTDREQ